MLASWIKSKDGVQVPFLFSNGVSAKLAIECEVSVSEVGNFFADMQRWPVGRLWRFYYLAAKEGARVERVRFDMSYDDFVSWMFDDEDVMGQIVKIMISSNPEGEKKTVGKVKEK